MGEGALGTGVGTRMKNWCVFISLERAEIRFVLLGWEWGLNWDGEAVLAFLSICQAFFQKICQRRKGN